MRTVELRKKLIEEIQQSSNKGLLEEMYHFLNQDNEVGSLYKLSQSQKAAIEEARIQVKNGEFYSDTEVNSEIDRWLEDK